MRRLRRFIPYLLAIGIVVLLLWQIDPREVVRLLAQADAGWLLLGLVCYMATNVIRALRYADLLPLGGHVASLRIIPIMFSVSLFNNVLPSRSGEVSFPYMMRQYHSIAVGESLAALVIARVFDYLAVAIFYIVFATANLHRLASGAATVVLIVAVLLLISLVMLSATPWLGRKVVAIADWSLRRLHLTGSRVGDVVLRVVVRTTDVLAGMRSVRVYAVTLWWSMLTWLGTFAWFACFMQGIGFPYPYGLIVVGATFAMLAKAIPFITVGGFGAHEAGWVVGFGLVGLAAEPAIASGFAVNILTLVMSVLCGGIALGAMWLFARKRLGGTRSANTATPAGKVDLE